MFTHSSPAEHYVITYLRIAQKIFTQAEVTPATLDFTILSKYARLRPFGDFNQNLGEALDNNVEAVLNSNGYKSVYALLVKEISQSKKKISAYLKKIKFPITKKSTLEKLRITLLEEIPDFLTLLRDHFPAGTNEEELCLISANLSRAYLYSFLKPGQQELDLFLNFFREALFRKKSVSKEFDKVMEASIVKSIKNVDNLYHHIDIIGIEKVTKFYIKNLIKHLPDFDESTLQMLVRSLAIMREKISNGRDVSEFKLISKVLKVFAKKALTDAKFKQDLEKYINAYSTPGSFTLPETKSELKYNAVNTIKKEYLRQLKLAKTPKKEKSASENTTYFKLPLIPPLKLSLLSPKNQTKNSPHPASNERDSAPKSNERKNSAPTSNRKPNRRETFKKSKTEDLLTKPSKSSQPVLSPRASRKSSTSHLLYTFEQDKPRWMTNSSAPSVPLVPPTITSQSSGGHKAQIRKSGSSITPQPPILSEVAQENPTSPNNGKRRI